MLHPFLAVLQLLQLMLLRAEKLPRAEMLPNQPLMEVPPNLLPRKVQQ